MFSIVPTPTVSVTAPNTQTVGQSLTLQCEVTAVRGITSRVDIVWRRGSRVVRIIRGASTTMNNSLVYTDNYTISQLSTTDEDRMYECRLVIHTSHYPIEVANVVRLNVTGECFTVTLYCECHYV